MWKTRKPDVVTFQLRLMDNILELQEDLVSRTYVHGGYKRFNISDPKPRVIHKATVEIVSFITFYIKSCIHISIGSLFLTRTRVA